MKNNFIGLYYGKELTEREIWHIDSIILDHQVLILEEMKRKYKETDKYKDIIVCHGVKVGCAETPTTLIISYELDVTREYIYVIANAVACEDWNSKQTTSKFLLSK